MEGGRGRETGQPTPGHDSGLVMGTEVLAWGQEATSAAHSR